MVLILFLAILSLVPWPMGPAVRFLLEKNDPTILQHLHWKHVFWQPSGGLLFTDLTLKPSTDLQVRAPWLRVGFSWFHLLQLQTRITSLHGDQVSIHWVLPKGNPDAKVSYAIPTESHLAGLLLALNSLQTVLATDVKVEAKHLDLHLGKDSMQIFSPRTTFSQHAKSWEMELRTGRIHRNRWPLPGRLQLGVILSDSALICKRLRAYWGNGCL